MYLKYASNGRSCFHVFTESHGEQHHSRALAEDETEFEELRAFAEHMKLVYSSLSKDVYSALLCEEVKLNQMSHQRRRHC
jgi:hypothetical protein